MLNQELARDTFGFYLWRWYLVMKPYIDAERARQDNDESLYENFEDLALKWAEVKGEITPERGERFIQLFLEDEANLTPQRPSY